MPIHPDIIIPVRIKWRTFSSAYKEHLSIQFQNYDFGKIELGVLSDISGKFIDLDKALTKINLTEYVIICVLLFSQFGHEIELTLFGLSFKNVAKYKEWFLLIFSGLKLYSTFYQLEKEHMKHVLEFLIEKKFDEEQQLFAKMRYLGLHYNGFVEVFSSKNISWHKVTAIPVVLFLLSAALIAVTVIFTMIATPIIATVSLLPITSDGYFTYVVFSISALSICATLSITALRMPMPVNDYEGIKKIAKLKEENPDEYQRQINLQITQDQSREINRGYYVTCIVSSATILALSIAFDRFALINDFANYILMIHKIIIALIASIPMLEPAKKAIYRIHRNRHSEFNPETFRKYRIALYFTNYAIPFIVSTIAFFALS